MSKDTLSKCMDCKGNADTRIKVMFTDGQKHRIATGSLPAKRAVFRKVHGIAHGHFEPVENLDKKYQVGVFGLGCIPAWVRFSSDTGPTSPDLKATSGIGIKLFDVPGEKLLGEGDTQDFILQNHDVFFVNDAEAMCEFTAAGVVDQNYPKYLAEHKETSDILDAMAKTEASVLTTTFWSGLPYAFGNEFVKYKLEPWDQSPGEVFDDNDYLAIDLQRRLRQGEARFKFLVQFQTNPEAMPLDKATVRWSEEESAPVHIATLVLKQQDICVQGQAEYGDNLSFNPWHCLPEHEPQGSLSAARKVTYAASSEIRHFANGVPDREPGCPRHIPAQQQSKDDCIVTAAIYPGIGITRVGSSRDEYFIGPEVSEPQVREKGYFRDSKGALKRQAARFRVYGLNLHGDIVKELTYEDADISWEVHLANQKSSWYEFQLALDIPEAIMAPPSLLRNATVSDRSKLTIDPGKRKIFGVGKQGKEYQFDDGQFMGKTVPLGELRTDDKGRLIVLGGFGDSASYTDDKAVTFANNETWHDDVSDGPVTALVKYKGTVLKVAPSWVVTAPPDYAPMQKSVRTMWDLMRDVAIQNRYIVQPEIPSFRHDIQPIFERLSNLQWVNAGFNAAFGWEGPFNFTSEDWMRRLSSESSAHRGLRRTLYQQFRQFSLDSNSPVPWPYVYGDAMSIPPADSPRQYAELSNTQMTFLKQWANGEFINDYDPNYEAPKQLDDVPVSEQGDMLDKASLEFCLADAFHPGCEMTWPVRNKGMYMGAYRFLHPVDPDWVEPSYGMQLTTDVLTLPDGPLLGGQTPGSISRWMAVPWQTDTASCRSGYDKSYDPYIPTFWPARVPNQVMTESAYQKTMDKESPLEQRKQAFSYRSSWNAPLNLSQGYTFQINEMIDNFDKMGVVEVHHQTETDEFPYQFQVSDQEAVIDPHPIQKQDEKKHTALNVARRSDPEKAIHDQDYDFSQIDKVRRFNRD
jgi:hypothetical protein